MRTYVTCLDEITAEDIIELRMTSQAVGVGPGILKNVDISNDRATIERTFEKYYWLNTTQITPEETQISGGSMLEVEFVLKDGSIKCIEIHSGTYKDENKNYPSLLYTPRFQNEDVFSSYFGFITYMGTGVVYSEESDEELCGLNDLGKMQFTEVVYYADNAPTHYIETEFGNLYIYDSYHFRYQDKFYELKNVNFYQMFESAVNT